MANNNNRIITFQSISDLECAVLGSCGFSTRMIEGETGLTPCQVGYRLRKAGVTRAEYRNGNSNISTMVLNLVRGPVKRVMKKDLTERFATPHEQNWPVKKKAKKKR